MSSLRTLIFPREFSGDVAHPGRRMTEREFVDWCRSDTWAEWIDGEVVVMSPVGLLHARIQAFLLHLFRAFVDEHDLGTVLNEPFQVRLARLRRRRSPDVLFVSTRRERLLAKTEMEGAPDLIVEVVSPESQSRDRREKFLEYEAAGVREYWIVDPESKTVELYALGADGKFKLMPQRKGRLRSKILRGLYIDPTWLLRIRLPKVSTLLREFDASR